MVQRSNRDPSRNRRAARSAGCCGDLASLLSPKLFKALSDSKRLALLIRLAEERRPCTVGQVAQGSGVDLSVVSRHLAILREVGIIGCVKRGKEVWCTMQTGAVARLLRDLAAALDACCPEERSADDSSGPRRAKRATGLKAAGRPR